MSNWLSIKDTHPEEGLNVLVFNLNFEAPAIAMMYYEDYDKSELTWDLQPYGQEEKPENIQYWMPLPSIPEEYKEELG